LSKLTVYTHLEYKTRLGGAVGSGRDGHLCEQREGKISRALTSKSLYWKAAWFEMESRIWKAITVKYSAML